MIIMWLLERLVFKQFDFELLMHYSTAINS